MRKSRSSSLEMRTGDKCQANPVVTIPKPTPSGGVDWVEVNLEESPVSDCMIPRVLMLTVALVTACTVGAATNALVIPFERNEVLTAEQPIDEAVLKRLKALGLQPANVCSDAVFVRRVYLDVIGTLPTGIEARDFLLDPTPGKRRALIDRLLARDEFADYWAMKWSDLLRIKSEFPINLWPNAVQGYHRWIRTSIRDNLPYDQFVRELLTASGSNFRVPQVNFYRAMQSKDPQSIAQAVALTFMGVRPESWPKERWAGMSAFFYQLGYKPTSEWKEEIIMFDPEKLHSSAATNPPPTAVFPDGQAARLVPDQDPREIFAGWLIDAKNPWFTANIANRVWSWLLGRGIIHEADDIRPDNPPTNPELLKLLEQDLVDSHYDLKHLFRIILNSKTYQLSSISRTDQPVAEANFASYPLRRLDAEVLMDALNQITGATERYSSPIPEPFTYIPEDHRSIALEDASITSSFLEMFGRPSRDTGLESERNNRPTAAQRLHLLNSTHILQKLQQSKKLDFLVQSRDNPRQIITGLYLMILSRFPTEAEITTALDYSRTSGMRAREATTDVAWALINAAEFQYRH